MSAESPYVGFGDMTPPLTPDHNPPPPYPLAKDPRNEACGHLPDAMWGKAGSCQHHCLTCGRWIWEQAITAKRKHPAPSGGES